MMDAIRNVIARCKVDRTGIKPQLTWLGGARTTPDVEHMQPQGYHFIASADAQGVLAAPAGDPSVAVSLGLGGPIPDGDDAPGEGGLHYLGSWRVYLAADGTIHLGEKDPGDAVAVASLTAAELQALSDRLAVFERIFATWVPVATDGGAALKTLHSADPGTPGATPGNVASTIAKLKANP